MVTIPSTPGARARKPVSLAQFVGTDRARFRHIENASLARGSRAENEATP
jgi:hypothetical protein